MKFKPSILSIASTIFLAFIITYTIVNYGQLSAGEGWGVAAMIGLFGVGVVLLILDFIIQQIFKSRTTVNIIGGVLTVIATLLIILG